MDYRKKNLKINQFWVRFKKITPLISKHLFVLHYQSHDSQFKNDLAIFSCKRKSHFFDFLILSKTNPKT